MLGLGILAGSGAAIIGVADTGKTDEAETLDAVLLLSLRTPGDLADPIGAHWVEEAARDFTGLGGVSVLTFVVLSAALLMAMAVLRATGSLGLIDGWSQGCPSNEPWRTASLMSALNWWCHFPKSASAMVVDT